MEDETGSKLKEIDRQISELRDEIANGKSASQTAQINLLLLLEKRASIHADIAWKDFNDHQMGSAENVQLTV